MATPESWRAWQSPVEIPDGRPSAAAHRELSDDVLIAIGCRLVGGAHEPGKVLDLVAQLLDRRTRPSVWSARLWNLVNEERIASGGRLDELWRWHPRRVDGKWVQGYALLGGDELRAYVGVATLLEAAA